MPGLESLINEINVLLVKQDLENALNLLNLKGNKIKERFLKCQ